LILSGAFYLDLKIGVWRRRTYQYSRQDKEKQEGSKFDGCCSLFEKGGRLLLSDSLVNNPK
jgi:hypothetical protein